MTLQIKDIVSDAVDNLRSYGSIASISEVSGVYTLISADTIEDLKINETVTLSDTPEFTDVYRILSIDYNTNAFTFQATKGKQTASLGTWNQEAPYFDSGTWREFINRITDKNKKIINNFRKYPYVYLIKGYTYNKVYGDLYDVNNIRIYIVKRSDINTYTSDKIDNTIPEIETIKNNLLKELDSSQNVVSDVIETEDVLPFAEDFLKSDEYTEMIEIGLEPLRILRRINCT